ncbi:two-component sensor histidine kinase [Opitutaceae bacterium EW11]|nr:two-component sensor histidine kinase [Opitutaceae bacterium EW11]
MATRPPAERRAHWSIRARLVVLYVGSVSLLILGSMIGLLYSLTDEIEDDDREFLYDQAALIRVLIEDSHDYALRAIELMQLDPDRNPKPFFYVRVMDREGHVLAATPEMDKVLPIDVFPIASRPHLEIIRWRDHARRSFLIGALRTTDKQRILQIGLDESSDEMFANVLKRNVIAVLAVGLLASAALAALVARSALRPLTALTAATSTVTARQLRATIDTAGWPVELVRLATAFEQMLARLEESFERLSQFSANLSHELRTPINNLRGEAEVALAKSRTAEDYRAVLESSLEEYGRVSRLIDNLLFLARAESDEIKIRRDELDARRECEAVVDFYEALAAEHQIETQLEGQGRILSDSVLFRRMLSNLMDNALRHTPPGGKVTFSIVPLADGSLEVAVADTGTGIPAENLSRIYDRFFRVEQTPPVRARNDGFGLGLSIVKSIMSLHQGTISVESEPGRGTRVRLIFPAHRVVR